LDQSLGGAVIIQSTDTSPALWRTERNGVVVGGVGAAGLLQGPLTAFFASRQCPGTAVLAATDWALQQAREHCALIGGFHSPLEQSVLRLLVEAGSSVVVVLARPVAGASLDRRWHGAIDAGRMAVISRTTHKQRVTVQAANDRNDIAARLADRVVVGHVTAGGALALQCTRWLGDGLAVRRVGDADAPG
jgi:hypothetical protein